MSDIPVYIDDENGIPVRPVTGDFEVMRVTDADGIPIRIDEIGGVPFVLSGYNPDPPQLTFQDFSMTAGQEGQWIGYSTGSPTTPQPAFGSIDRQPTDQATLLAFYDDTASGVFLAVFSGNHVQALQGLELSIGGYVVQSFEVELISGNTWVRFDGIPGDLMSGASYEVLFGYDLSPSQARRIMAALSPYSIWSDVIPNDPAYWFQDAAGTIPVTSAGQRVKAVRSVGGRLNASSSSDDASPMSALQGGIWSMVFDGVDDRLTTTATVNFSASNRMMIAASAMKEGDLATGVVAALGNFEVVTAGSATLRFPRSSTQSQVVMGYNYAAGQPRVAASGVPTGQYSAIVVGSSSPSEVTVRYNRGTPTSMAITGPSAAGLNASVVFGNQPSPFRGRIGMLVMASLIADVPLVVQNQISDIINESFGAY